MNFSSHLQNIKKSVITALSADKEMLINDFMVILIQSSKLLSCNDFNFWLSELKTNDWNNLPITSHAVDEVKSTWLNYTPAKNSLSPMLYDSCEKLFTFWLQDDVCDVQYQYFYYKDGISNTIYKDSGMNCIGIAKNQTIAAKIALISDLEASIAFSDWYE